MLEKLIAMGKPPEYVYVMHSVDVLSRPENGNYCIENDNWRCVFNNKLNSLKLLIRESRMRNCYRRGGGLLSTKRKVS